MAVMFKLTLGGVGNTGSLVEVSKYAMEKGKVVVENKVEFRINSFRVPTHGLNDPFFELNTFISTMKSSVQDQIFNLYYELRMKMDNEINEAAVTEYTKYLCETMASIIDIEQVYIWLNQTGIVAVPKDVPVRYAEDIDDNRSRDKTYIREEYLYLIAYSIALRPYIAVWGEYMNTHRRALGSQFKERAAFDLMNDTHIPKSRPYARLLLYIESLMENDSGMDRNALRGISSEDYAEHSASFISVRKLTLVDLQKYVGNGPQNLISLLFGFVQQRLRPTNTPFIRDKESGGETSETRNSGLEQYKMKTNITVGEKAEIEAAVSDPYKVLHTLDPNIDPKILERTLKRTEILMNAGIPDVSVRILQWIIKPVIPSRGVSYLPKPVLVRLLAVAEVYLESRGHDYFSILVTSYQDTDQDNSIMIGASDSRDRTPREMNEELGKVFPFSFTGRLAERNIRESKYILVMIAKFVEDLVREKLRPTCVPSKLVKVFGNDRRIFSIVSDIRVLLAGLVLELGKRR